MLAFAGAATPFKVSDSDSSLLLIGLVAPGSRGPKQKTSFCAPNCVSDPAVWSMKAGNDHALSPPVSVTMRAPACAALSQFVVAHETEGSLAGTGFAVPPSLAMLLGPICISTACTAAVPPVGASL